MIGTPLFFSLCFLFFAIGSLAQQQCNQADNTDSRGLNPACNAPRFPYCLNGMCYMCNPYLGSDYVCDCSAQHVCAEDFTLANVGQCIAPPKYGQPCSSPSDCVTTYSDGGTFSDLICLSGVCRQCDPSGSQAVPYNCTVGYVGQQRACISPGYWGVPGSKGPSGTSGSPRAA